MVIFKIVCCHGNSLQHTHNLWKRNPRCVANLHCECQELKPKGETNSSFLVLHPSSGVHTTVKTVGSHLKHRHSGMLSYVIPCSTFLKKFHSEKIKTNIIDNPALVLIATGSSNSSKISKIIPHLISRLILIGRNGLMWTYYTIATEHKIWTELAGGSLVGCKSTDH